MTARHTWRALLVVGTTARLSGLTISGAQTTQEPPAPAAFPLGTATPSEACGACHKAIYREFATGFGSDLRYRAILYRSPEGDRLLGLPASVSATATLHALAAADPFPQHARTVEDEGRSCNVCHFPQAFDLPDIETPAIPKPSGRRQGPHEAPIRAGEERLLSWAPKLRPGNFTVRASLIYDLNRYNDKTFVGDQTEIFRSSLPIDIAAR